MKGQFTYSRTKEYRLG